MPKVKNQRGSNLPSRRSSRVSQLKGNSNWWTNLSDASIRRSSIAYRNANLITSDSEVDSKTNPEFWKEITQDESGLANAIMKSRKKISDNYEEQENISEVEVEKKRLFTKKNTTNRFSKAFSESTDEEIKPEEEQKETHIEEAGPSKQERVKKKKSIFSRKTKVNHRFSAAFDSVHKDENDVENEPLDIEMNNEQENLDVLESKKLLKNKTKNTHNVDESFSKTVTPKATKLFNKTKKTHKFSDAFSNTDLQQSKHNSEPESNEVQPHSENVPEKPKTKKVLIKSKKSRKNSEANLKTATEQIKTSSNEAPDIEISANEQENLDVLESKQLFNNKTKNTHNISESFSKTETPKTIKLFIKTKNTHKFSDTFSNTDLQQSKHDSEPESNEAINSEIASENPKTKNVLIKSKNPRKKSEAYLKAATEQCSSGLELLHADTEIPNSNLFKDRVFSESTTAVIAENISVPETNQKELEKSLQIAQMPSKNLLEKQILANKKNVKILSKKSNSNTEISKEEEDPDVLLNSSDPKIQNQTSLTKDDNLETTEQNKQSFKNKLRKYSEAFSKVETTNERALIKDNSLEITTEQNKQFHKTNTKNASEIEPNLQNILSINTSLETSTEVQQNKQLFKETEQTEIIEMQRRKSSVRRFSEAFSAVENISEAEKSLIDTEVNEHKRSRTDETEFRTISSINDSSESEKRLVFKPNAPKNQFNKTSTSSVLETIQSKRLSCTSNSCSSKFFDTSLISSTKIINLTSGNAVSEYTPGKKLIDSTKKQRLSSRKSGSLLLKPIIEALNFQSEQRSQSRTGSITKRLSANEFKNDPIIEQEPKTKKLRNSTMEKLLSTLDEHSQEHTSNNETSVNKSRYVRETKIDKSTHRKMITSENDAIPLIKSKQNKLSRKTTKSSDVGEYGQANSNLEVGSLGHANSFSEMAEIEKSPTLKSQNTKQNEHSQEHTSSKEASINTSRYVTKTKIDKATKWKMITSETESEIDEIPVIKSKQNKLSSKTIKSSDLREPGSYLEVGSPGQANSNLEGGSPGQAISLPEIEKSPALKSKNTKQNEHSDDHTSKKEASINKSRYVKKTNKSSQRQMISSEIDEIPVIKLKKKKKSNKTTKSSDVGEPGRATSYFEVGSFGQANSNFEVGSPGQAISLSEIAEIEKSPALKSHNIKQNEHSQEHTSNKEASINKSRYVKKTKIDKSTQRKLITSETESEINEIPVIKSKHNKLSSKTTKSSDVGEPGQANSNLQVGSPGQAINFSEIAEIEKSPALKSQNTEHNEQILSAIAPEEQPNNKITSTSNELENFHAAEDLIIKNLMHKTNLDKSSSDRSILAAYFSPEKNSLDINMKQVDEKQKNIIEKHNAFLKLFAQAGPTSKKNYKINNAKQGKTSKVPYSFPTLHNYGLPQKSKTLKQPKEIQTARLVNGKIYKKTKLFKGAKWCNARFYMFLQKKMENKYNERTVVESENLMKHIYSATRVIHKSKKYMKQEVNQLIKELARSGVIETRFDFYLLVEKYLPFECRVKIIPCRQAHTTDTFAPYTPGMFEKIQF